MQDKSRAYGVLICIGTVVAAIFFLWGLSKESYWAIAVPVLIGFLTLLGLAFWVGWTIVTVKSEVPSPTMSGSDARPGPTAHFTHESSPGIASASSSPVEEREGEHLEGGA